MYREGFICEPLFRCELFIWCELITSAIRLNGRLRLKVTFCPRSASLTFSLSLNLKAPLFQTLETRLPASSSLPASTSQYLAGNYTLSSPESLSFSLTAATPPTPSLLPSNFGCPNRTMASSPEHGRPSSE